MEFNGLLFLSASLFVTNGAVVNSSTFGRGNGGNIRINADVVVAVKPPLVLSPGEVAIN